MGMTVRRVKDTRTKKVFMHKIADIRGGVAVKTSELGGDYIPEGAVLSQPDNGICHVVKIAQVIAEVTASGTEIKIAKNSCFKVGDFVMAEVGAKAYAITAIDYSNSEYDTVTIGTTPGKKIEKGAFIAEAAVQSADTTSALKYQPLSMVGTGKPFKAGDNVDTDAWIIGVTTGNPLPAFIELKGIINY